MQKTIGLVLSGGGTKGVAHAGVLQFLEENEINVDVFSCCSAGSIVASLYVMGKTPQEILQFFSSIYFFNWKHFAFNKPGLVSSVIFREYLRPIFGDMLIGELPKPVKIVATELVSGEQVVFADDFKVVDAIIASCSIPGVATPFRYKNEIFCDGGVLNNFPADHLYGQCDQMIGVFVSPPSTVKLEDLSTIKSVISRSYDLISYQIEQYKFDYCDWFITSQQLSNFGPFERNMSRLKEIYDIGYFAAKESCPLYFTTED